jgi:hypothetical protein
VMNCDQVLTQNLRHYMLHMLRSPTESCAVEVGRSHLQNGGVAYGSIATKISQSGYFRLSLNSGSTGDIVVGPVRANFRLMHRGRKPSASVVC